jgi:hypothetical protein
MHVPPYAWPFNWTFHCNRITVSDELQMRASLGLIGLNGSGWTFHCNRITVSDELQMRVPPYAWPFNWTFHCNRITVSDELHWASSG